MESEDILHSVFKDALSDLHRFQPQNPHSVNRYLHVCVLNKIRSKADYFAAQKRSGEVPLSDSIIQRIPNRGGRRAQYTDGERFERLEKALARLPDDMREVILLRRIEELPNRDAASRSASPPKRPRSSTTAHSRSSPLLMRGAAA